MDFFVKFVFEPKGANKLKSDGISAETDFNTKKTDCITFVLSVNNKFGKIC